MFFNYLTSLSSDWELVDAAKEALLVLHRFLLQAGWFRGLGSVEISSSTDNFSFKSAGSLSDEIERNINSWWHK